MYQRRCKQNGEEESSKATTRARTQRRKYCDKSKVETAAATHARTDLKGVAREEILLHVERKRFVFIFSRVDIT